MKQLIKAPNGSTRGFFILNEATGVKQIYATNGKMLGQYNPNMNITTTASGACVGFGDQTIMLLEN